MFKLDLSIYKPVLRKKTLPIPIKWLYCGDKLFSSCRYDFISPSAKAFKGLLHTILYWGKTFHFLINKINSKLVRYSHRDHLLEEHVIMPYLACKKRQNIREWNWLLLTSRLISTFLSFHPSDYAVAIKSLIDYGFFRVVGGEYKQSNAKLEMRQIQTKADICHETVGHSGVELFYSQ